MQGVAPLQSIAVIPNSGLPQTDQLTKNVSGLSYRCPDEVAPHGALGFPEARNRGIHGVIAIKIISER